MIRSTLPRFYRRLREPSLGLAILLLCAADVIAVPWGDAWPQLPTTRPLDDAIASIDRSVVPLACGETGSPVQRLQRHALEQIDGLIAVLEQEGQESQGSGAADSPGQPLDNSRKIAGAADAEVVVEVGPESERRESATWGELPPRDRDRIRQVLSAGLPSRYQQMLEDYYRQLAEGSEPSE